MPCGLFLLGSDFVQGSMKKLTIRKIFYEKLTGEREKT